MDGRYTSHTSLSKYKTRRHQNSLFIVSLEIQTLMNLSNVHSVTHNQYILEQKKKLLFQYGESGEVLHTFITFTLHSLTHNSKIFLLTTIHITQTANPYADSQVR